MALFTKDSPSPRPPSRTEPALTPAGTHFGPNVVIEGTITGSEAVLIEGTVRGTINITSDLRIGSKARVEANVHGRNVMVEGKLTGDVSADERVELIASSTVDGNIKAPKIVVAEGARFRGSVDMGSTRPREGSESK